MNFGSNECTEISLMWNKLIISSCFEACGVQGLHLPMDLFCMYSAKNEEIYGIVPYQKFLSCYITSKTKTSTCGSQVSHMWVTSELFCGSSGSTGVTHFQPWCKIILLWGLRINIMPSELYHGVIIIIAIACYTN